MTPLARCERTSSPRSTLYKVFGLCRCGLPRNRLHDGKNVLGAMVDFAQEQINVLFMAQVSPAQTRH
jgi:hypothetical protein